MTDSSAGLTTSPAGATNWLSSGARGKRVFVTGATGILGYRVVRALLDEGAQVTALIQPDGEDRLGNLRGYVHSIAGDVWNPSSLKGRARGHGVVVHLVGGIKPDLSRGLTFRYLNTFSARNVMQMAVSDGVSHFVLLSAESTPWGVSAEYLESKREAEGYLKKTGLDYTIIRAPALYVPGGERNPIYVLLGLLRMIPLVGLLGGTASLAVDTAARAIASLAVNAPPGVERIVSARRLRQIGQEIERKISKLVNENTKMNKRRRANPVDEDEPPFGWLPPAPKP